MDKSNARKKHCSTHSDRREHDEKTKNNACSQKNNNTTPNRNAQQQIRDDALGSQVRCTQEQPTEHFEPNVASILDQNTSRAECTGLTVREMLRIKMMHDDESDCNGTDNEPDASSLGASPGAHRVHGFHRGITNERLSSSDLDDDVDGNDNNRSRGDGESENQRCCIGAEEDSAPIIIQAELAADVDDILAENTSLKARLKQLEEEREHMLIVDATPSPTSKQRSKMDITKASKLVCETTDEMDRVFSTKRPANSQAGIASGLKNLGKGVAAGVAGFLGEVVAGCASGEGATRAATGIGRGLVKFFALPAAGAVVGLCQIGRGVASTLFGNTSKVSNEDGVQSNAPGENRETVLETSP